MNRKTHPLYRVWCGMKSRCYDKRSPNYRMYGARGIYVCHEWLNSFPTFLVDMGSRPTGMQLDRINNDGPYSPQNCRWATPKEQANNRSNMRTLTIGGDTKKVTTWCQEHGINTATFYKRIRAGMSEVDAVTTPNRRRFISITIDNTTMPLPAWCAKNKIGWGTAWGRIRRGWPPEKAVTHPIGPQHGRK